VEELQGERTGVETGASSEIQRELQGFFLAPDPDAHVTLSGAKFACPMNCIVYSTDN